MHNKSTESNTGLYLVYMAVVSVIIAFAVTLFYAANHLTRNDYEAHPDHIANSDIEHALGNHERQELTDAQRKMLLGMKSDLLAAEPGFGSTLLGDRQRIHAEAAVREQLAIVSTVCEPTWTPRDNVLEFRQWLAVKYTCPKRMGAVMTHVASLAAGTSVVREPKADDFNENNWTLPTLPVVWTTQPRLTECSWEVVDANGKRLAGQSVKFSPSPLTIDLRKHVGHEVIISNCGTLVPANPEDPAVKRLSVLQNAYYKTVEKNSRV